MLGCDEAGFADIQATALNAAISGSLRAHALVDNAMIQAVARALETGAYGNIEELAAAEKINSSYVSRYCG